jgi:hypothetical protein
MTRLARASALMAVFAGDYAILMLIDGQLTDFDVSASVCAAALLGAGLFECVVRLSRRTLAHGRAAVWERREREASTVGLKAGSAITSVLTYALSSEWSTRERSLAPPPHQSPPQAAAPIRPPSPLCATAATSRLRSARKPRASR